MNAPAAWFVVFAAAVFGLGVGFTIMIVNECGWSALLLGKAAPWLWILGYCG